MKVIIVRDRASAGGGIHNYYEALRPHFNVDCEFVDVGRAHSFFKTPHTGQTRYSTVSRLVADWWSLILKLFNFPDLVHLNPGLDAKIRRSLRRDAVSLWMAKLFRRPVLVFWRGWEEEASGAAEFPGGKGGWLCQSYQLADAHIVLASEFKQHLRRWGFTAPIHVETTVAAEAILEASPQARMLDPARVNLLFLSRVEIDKGVLELLAAFRQLQARRPHVYTLTIAGDGSFLKALREQVESLGVRGIDFAGYVTGQAKIQCYLQASIFCFLSSHGEGMPNAVLEAMAMGLPVVSSNVGGLKDVLSDGETGFIVERNKEDSPGAKFSVSEVVDRIEQVAGDPELYRRMSEHNRRLARERFAAKKVAAQLESIYRGILSSTGGPGRE